MARWFYLSLTFLMTTLAGLAGCATNPLNGYEYKPIDDVLRARETSHATLKAALDDLVRIEGRSYLELSLELHNKSAEEPLAVEIAQQLLTLPSKPPTTESPALYSLEGEKPRTPAPVALAPGQKVHLHLYYPLPDSLDAAGKLPGFTLDWKIAGLGADLVTFDRAAEVPPTVIESAMPGNPIGRSWGPSWWYDPLIPTAPFRWPTRWPRSVP